MVKSPPEVIDWLKQFAQAVREKDIDRGRQLFSEQAYSYGTVAIVVSTLDQLVSSQWQQIWPVTEGFDFDYEKIWCRSGDRQHFVAAQWVSTGCEGSRQLGPRQGRASIVLELSEDQAYIASHSHFSLNPDTA